MERDGSAGGGDRNCATLHEHPKCVAVRASKDARPAHCDQAIGAADLEVVRTISARMIEHQRPRLQRDLTSSIDQEPVYDDAPPFAHPQGGIAAEQQCEL